KRPTLYLLIGFICFLMLGLGPAANRNTPRKATLGAKRFNPGRPLKLNQTYGQLPLAFEPNRGQFDPQVQFLSRGSGYNLYLTSQEAVLSLHKPHPNNVRGR